MRWWKQASPLEKPAVVNPGGDGYANGVGGVPAQIMYDALQMIPGEDELIDAGGYAPPMGFGYASYNLPPLMNEGTAQRTRPGPLALVEFTPIGPGEVWEKSINPCTPSEVVFDARAWAQGLGQIANQIAIVYSAGMNEGSGAVQGAGVIGMPYVLPSDLSVAYVSEYLGELVPPAGGPSFGGTY